MKRYCFFCGEEINDAEDYYEIDCMSFYYDVFEKEHGYKRIEKNKFVHQDCLHKAKRYFKAIEKGEIE